MRLINTDLTAHGADRNEQMEGCVGFPLADIVAQIIGLIRMEKYLNQMML